MDSPNETPDREDPEHSHDNGPASDETRGDRVEAPPDDDLRARVAELEERLRAAEARHKGEIRREVDARLEAERGIAAAEARCRDVESEREQERAGRVAAEGERDQERDGRVKAERERDRERDARLKAEKQRDENAALLQDEMSKHAETREQRDTEERRAARNGTAAKVLGTTTAFSLVAHLFRGGDETDPS